MAGAASANWPPVTRQEQNSNRHSDAPTTERPLIVPRHEDSENSNRLLLSVPKPNEPKNSELLADQKAPSLKPQIAQAEHSELFSPLTTVLESGVKESGDAEANRDISELVYGPTSCSITTTGGNIRRVSKDDDGTPRRDAHGLPLTMDPPLFVVNTCIVLTRPPPRIKYKSIWKEE